MHKALFQSGVETEFNIVKHAHVLFVPKHFLVFNTPYLQHQENEVAEGYSTTVTPVKMFESDGKKVAKKSKINLHYYRIV